MVEYHGKNSEQQVLRIQFMDSHFQISFTNLKADFCSIS